MENTLQNGRNNRAVLLFAIGVSNVGDWIYLIALNLIIFDMTQSVLAVTVLYVLRPVAALVTNLWAGSVIDRANKRNVMVVLDVIRGALIMVMPLITSVSFIFILVFLVNMASAIFHPTSTTYITKLVPESERLRFNAIRSLLQSGGFITGPAIAGLLFLVGSPMFAILMNAFSFIISGLVTRTLPNVDEDVTETTKGERIHFALIRNDVFDVLKYSRQKGVVMIVIALFYALMILTTAVDSLEAVFAKSVLGLSNNSYGLLVSIAGIGIALGAMLNTLFSKRLHPNFIMVIGAIFLGVGYAIYAFSNTFLVAAYGFFILSFALAFANTGFDTFF
ncbi:MAG: MFS transporter, partial [Bacilli bacterium]